MSSFSDFCTAIYDRRTALDDTVGFHPTVGEVISRNDVEVVRPEDFGIDPKSYRKLYPKVLMACEKDQVTLLLEMYPKYAPSPDVILTWLALTRRGLLPQLLETSNKVNVEHFMLVNAGISAAFETMERRT